MRPRMMPEPPRRSWTVEEFLDWHDGTGRRHQLVRGEIVAMAPPLIAHGDLVASLAGELRARLRRPCRVTAEAGLRIPNRNDTFYQADLVISCSPRRPGERYLEQPLVIVEVLSPSTEEDDRGLKLPDYQSLPSVQEIALFAADRRQVALWRRGPAGWVALTLEGDAVLHLDSVGIELPLAACYDDETAA